MGIILEMRTLSVQKLLNVTNLGIGRRGGAEIFKFGVDVTLGVCSCEKEVVLDHRPIKVPKSAKCNKCVG